MADEPAISLDRLSKHFRVNQREPGLWPALRALVRREYVEVEAVHELSFTIARGERVGFLGPNGAGKTTTLKMLAGLLHPTAGSARVLGFEPARRRPAFLRRIALVMGQKRQLSWDLPPLDTFELNRVVFDVPREQYEPRLAQLVELLEVGEVVRKPVRTLSLGERMKCELIAALLHGPEVLFLDEPTIGMDVSMQLAIRAFIREYHRQTGATLILTSHYMEDVSALCERILVIDEGRLRFDGGIDALVREIKPLRRVAVHLGEALGDEARTRLSRLGTIVEAEGASSRSLALDVAPAEVPAVVNELLALPGASDLRVHDAPLEEVMRELFARRPDRDRDGQADGQGSAAS